jgi:phage replication O-like protein O
MKNNEGQFIGFQTPRYTQVPDELFDELLAELSGSELKVLLYVIRRTFGFKRDSDHISLSQMVSGIRRRDGTALDLGTGLSKDTVVLAVKALVKKGVLVQNKVYSEETGYEASEYALKIIVSPLSENPARGDVPKIGQGVVEKPDRQETAKQETVRTFRNVTKIPIRTAPVDNLRKTKEEYLSHLILEVCHDRQSIGWYRKVVRLLPEQVVHEALSQVKQAQQLGRIRERPGAMFTDLIKRKAVELGIKFGSENRKEKDDLREMTSEASTIEAPAEMIHFGPRR